MYVDRLTILLLILGVGAYFYLKKRAWRKRVTERLNYLSCKFEKQTAINEGYVKRLDKLSQIVHDLITLTLVKRLADSDMKRFKIIRGENYKGNDSLDKWANESKDRGVIEVRQIRDLHKNFLKKLDQVVELYDQTIQKLLEGGINTHIEQCMQDLMDAYISAETFYTEVNKTRSVYKDSFKPEVFSRQVNIVISELEKIINSINDIKFTSAHS